MSTPTFARLGGVYQLRFEGPEDLERLDQLDEARWAVTSLPLEQLHCDPRFLSFLDQDTDGRVRVREIQAARRWLWERLARRERVADPVVERREILRLGDLAPGQVGLLELARQVLAAAGKPQAEELSLAELRAYRAAYVLQFPNGDGVVPAEHGDDTAMVAQIGHVVAVTGGKSDHSGSVGVDVACLDAFQAAAGAQLAWRTKGGLTDPTVLPLGEGSQGECAEALSVIDRLDPRVRQFFAQSRLLAVAQGAAEHLAGRTGQLAGLDLQDPQVVEAWVRAAPLQVADESGVLDLDRAVNPFDRDDLERLVGQWAPRLLGASVRRIGLADWERIVAAFAPYRVRLAERPVGFDDAVPDAELRAIAAGQGLERLRERCAADAAVAGELALMDDLERVVLTQRWLWELVNNSVCLEDLFGVERRALFEAGTLIIDGRRMNLCQKVSDRAAHKVLATQSLLYVLYVDAARKDASGLVTMQLAVGITDGVRGGIGPGKRGVFYDREGHEWDAVVVDQIVNPISLVEAMVAPFVRARDAIMERFEKATSEQATGMEGKLGERTVKVELPTPPVVTDPQGAPAPAPPPEKAPADKSGGQTQNLLIGGSLAFAALGSTLAFVMKTIAEIPVLTLGLALVGVALMLLALSATLAWFKLRRRDLSAWLEASGMALNGRMRLSSHLAGRFTQTPGLPAGARRTHDEPMGPLEKVGLLVVLLGLCLGLAFYQFGDTIQGWLPSAPAEGVAPAAESPPATAPLP